MTTQIDMVAQGSDAWFLARKNRLTGSNVGAVLGVDPWRDRNDVMRAMVREHHGAETEFKGTPATQWGNANEGNARLEFELESGLDCTDAPFVEFEDWFGASPDAFVGDDALAEFKCPYSLRKDTQPIFKKLADQPHYYAQVQAELHCTGRVKCHFYQYTPYGSDWTVVHVDHAWRDENLPKLRQFYAEYLYERDNNAAEHLAARRVTLDSPEAHKMVREYDELVEQLAWLEERKKDLLAQIVQAAGEKDAEFAGRKLTKVEKAGAISYAKAIKELLLKADLEPYRGKPSSYWKLS